MLTRDVGINYNNRVCPTRHIKYVVFDARPCTEAIPTVILENMIS